MQLVTQELFGQIGFVLLPPKLPGIPSFYLTASREQIRWKRSEKSQASHTLNLCNADKPPREVCNPGLPPSPSRSPELTESPTRDDCLCEAHLLGLANFSGGFPKSGQPFWGPNNKDSGNWVSRWGGSYFGKLPNGIPGVPEKSPILKY